jgi:riboflavin kinase/FMN adenylyltransferase
VILTLGAFDGFHRGHRLLLEEARGRAEEQRLDWGVATFTNHPQAVLTGKSFRTLFTSRERSLLARRLSVPELIEIPFTRAFADLSPAAFLDYLEARWPIHGLVVGENFRFGRARIGDPVLLHRECESRGWSLGVLPPLLLGGTPVSSTRIRECLAVGDMERVRELLGHPFFVMAPVVSGDRRGRTIGFPTANLSLRPEKVTPERGVYAAWAWTPLGTRPAAVNVGFNPTFQGMRSLRFEVHLLDFEGDLYGRDVAVLLLNRVRQEVRFDGARELCLQMERDVREVREKVEEALRAEGKRFARWERLLADRPTASAGPQA